MTNMVDALQRRASIIHARDQKQEPGADIGLDADLEIREEAAEALALVERASRSITTRMCLYLERPLATDKPSRRGKYQVLANDLIRSVEDVAGVPVGLQLENPNVQGVQSQSNILAIAHELEAVKRIVRDLCLYALLIGLLICHFPLSISSTLKLSLQTTPNKKRSNIYERLFIDDPASTFRQRRLQS